MSDLYIDVHGLSHHFSSEKFQQSNIGGGLRWEEQSDGKRLMATVGMYLNSLDRGSLYITAGARWPVAKYVEVGALGGFATNYFTPIAPVVLPVVSIGTRKARLNFMAAPAIVGVMPAAVMVSAQIRIR